MKIIIMDNYYTTLVQTDDKSYIQDLKKAFDEGRLATPWRVRVVYFHDSGRVDEYSFEVCDKYASRSEQNIKENNSEVYDLLMEYISHDVKRGGYSRT